MIILFPIYIRTCGNPVRSIDSKNAILGFRSFKCSMKTSNRDNWYSKLYSRKHTVISYAEKDIHTICNDNLTLKLTPKIRTECSKIVVASFLGGLFICQKPNTCKIWRVRTGCSGNTNRDCAINSIWNTEVVHPLLRSNVGRLTIHVFRVREDTKTCVH